MNHPIESLREIDLTASDQFDALCCAQRWKFYTSPTVYIQLDKYPQTKMFLKMIEDIGPLSDEGLELVDVIHALEHGKITFICHVQLGRAAMRLQNREEGGIVVSFDEILKQCHDSKYDDVFGGVMASHLDFCMNMMVKQGAWSRKICKAVISYERRFEETDIDKVDRTLEKYMPVILLHELAGGFATNRALQRTTDEAFGVDLKWSKFLEFCDMLKTPFQAAGLDPEWLAKAPSGPPSSDSLMDECTSEASVTGRDRP